MKISGSSISLQNAVHVKSAELWLLLGQPLEALGELQHLPLRSRKHPWAMEVFTAIARAFC